MKASVVKCIEDLVTEKFGRDKWDAILSASGLPGDSMFLPIADVPDEKAMEIVQNTAAVLGITVNQALDAFADYWVNVYGLKVYKAYYHGAKTAREFMLRLDGMHERLTRNIANAKPPRFAYEWKNADTLVMTYQSERGLIDLAVSMTKAIGTYFGEEINVTKLSTTRLEIVFSK
jgi:hypothetical protein